MPVDIESVVELLTDTAEVVSKPKATEWGTRAVIRDPDGRSVELYEVLQLDRR